MPPYVAGAASALHNGKTWKRILRIEKAARLTALGVFSDGDIARQIGITQVTLSVLKQTPEFKSKMIELQTGVIAQTDLEVRESYEFQREEIKSMVPLALMRLRTLALSKNENIAYKAATEILDRDGDHAKVSRSSVTIEDKTDSTAANAVAADIMAILRGQPAQSQPDVDNTMEEFTKGAMDSESQTNLMADVINGTTLEDIDASKLKIN